MIFCAGVQHPHETLSYKKKSLLSFFASVFFENYVHVYVSSKLKVDKIFQRSALEPTQDSKTST